MHLTRIPHFLDSLYHSSSPAPPRALVYRPALGTESSLSWLPRCRQTLRTVLDTLLFLCVEGCNPRGPESSELQHTVTGYMSYPFLCELHFLSSYFVIWGTKQSAK